MINNFFQIPTSLQPFPPIPPPKQTNFPQHSTIFYSSSSILYPPFIPFFIPPISKPPTLKQLLLPTIIYPTLPSMLFFPIFPNYPL
ncbi:BCCT family transporter, partial [Staphylococcus saprophyticus]|uniref:BCCT family transporter n=1 Tax=Staphylococcus saprophyticus TaxID=29385 RepID=UPI0037041DCA